MYSWGIIDVNQIQCILAAVVKCRAIDCIMNYIQNSIWIMENICSSKPKLFTSIYTDNNFGLICILNALIDSMPLKI